MKSDYHRGDSLNKENPDIFTTTTTSTTTTTTIHQFKQQDFLYSETPSMLDSGYINKL